MRSALAEGDFAQGDFAGRHACESPSFFTNAFYIDILIFWVLRVHSYYDTIPQ